MNNLFIVNPVAGKGKALKFVPEIENYFKTSNENFTIEYTKYPKHAIELTRKYAALGFDRVISIGGDGTLSEVLNGVVNSTLSLGVIPAGSGDDFYRTLTGGHDTTNIIERTLNGTEKYVDIGIANDKFFLNIASIGFDAQVAHTTNLLKKNSIFTGSTAYLAGILLTLIKNRTYSLNISIDDDLPVKHELSLIAIANGKYYGSGIMPAPQADIFDGKFDTCLVDKVSRLRILKFFPLYKKGLHSGIKEVSFKHHEKIVIESSSSVPLNLDGEVFLTNKVEISIVPAAIKILMPKRSY